MRIHVEHLITHFQFKAFEIGAHILKCYFEAVLLNINTGIHDLSYESTTDIDHQYKLLYDCLYHLNVHKNLIQGLNDAVLQLQSAGK